MFHLLNPTHRICALLFVATLLWGGWHNQLSFAQEPSAVEASDLNAQQENYNLRFIHTWPFTNTLEGSALTVKLDMPDDQPDLELGTIKYGTASVDFEGANKQGFISIPLSRKRALIKLIDVSGTEIYSETLFVRATDTNYTVIIRSERTSDSPIFRLLEQDIKAEGSYYVINSIVDKVFDVQITMQREKDTLKILPNFSYGQVNDLTYLGPFEAIQYTFASQDGEVTLATPFIRTDYAGPAEIIIIGDGKNQPYRYLYIGQQSTFILKNVYLPIIEKPSPEANLPAPSSFKLVPILFETDDPADDGRYKIEWNRLKDTIGYQTDFSFNNPEFDGQGLRSTQATYRSGLYTWPGTHYWRVRGKFGVGNKTYYGPWSEVKSITVKPYAYISVSNRFFTGDILVTVSGNGINKTVRVNPRKSDYFATIPVGTYTVRVEGALLNICAGVNGTSRTEQFNFANDTYVNGDSNSGIYRISECYTAKISD